MPATRVLVLFASTHGHTAKIADRIGDVLRAEGLAARVRPLGKDAIRIDPSEFDAYILAGSVHAGHHQQELMEWASEHRTILSDHPSAFVSVSLTAADDSDEAITTVKDMIDDVLDKTGWTPTTTFPVAGAFQFEEYNLATRVIMRLIARKVEHAMDQKVDVHHDTDYTDWPAVEAFAKDFGATASAAANAA